MIRTLVVVALAVQVLGTAHAEVVTFAKSPATLTLDDSWQPQRARGIVAGYKTAGGAVLAVTRADVPNADAWRSETKAAYAEQVARGITASVPGSRRARHKLVDANGVPALELEARGAAGATVVVRVLLFRTYALSLAIEVPKGGDLRAARAIARSFAPPKQAPVSE